VPVGRFQSINQSINQSTNRPTVRVNPHNEQAGKKLNEKIDLESPKVRLDLRIDDGPAHPMAFSSLHLTPTGHMIEEPIPFLPLPCHQVVNTLELAPGEKKVFCRCWLSDTFPLCNGAHQKHNEATGDNVGPLIVSTPKPSQ
jgi:hypothetical protein